MKSLLTITTGILFFAASSASACPLMEAKQQTTDLSHQDQTQQTLVENEVDNTDPRLLAKLMLEAQVEKIN